MKLIPDWRTLWHRLWSVRLSLLAALLSAIEVGVQTWLEGRPPLLMIGVMVMSLGASVARIVAQPKLHE